MFRGFLIWCGQTGDGDRGRMSNNGQECRRRVFGKGHILAVLRTHAHAVDHNRCKTVPFPVPDSCAAVSSRNDGTGCRQVRKLRTKPETLAKRRVIGFANCVMPVPLLLPSDANTDSPNLTILESATVRPRISLRCATPGEARRQPERADL